MTRTISLAALAVVTALSGCGPAQQMAMSKAKERLVAANATCDAQFQDHYSERADCYAASENAILLPLVMNEGDLLALYQAQRKVTAMRLDRHEITLEEARLDDAAARVAMKQQAINRSNATEMVDAARFQSTPILVPVQTRHHH